VQVIQCAGIPEPKDTSLPYRAVVVSGFKLDV